MKTLIASLVLASLALVGSAHAKPRKSTRPVVCELYALVVDDAADGREIAVCYDKHVEGGLVLRYYTEMTVQSPSGPAKVVVGYR